ncbi:hypothetical protein MNV49_005163 [Pseudohyphozyma bogoriensis]|nr:hypothetical protein MNV49_005163 [Pseudohyphozyma bogoriensis]
MSNILTPEQVKVRQQLGRYEQLFDPVFCAFFNEHIAGRAASHQVSIEELRANPALYAVKGAPPEAPSIGREYDLKCPVTTPEGEITIKIYEPESAGEEKVEPRALYYHTHGGAFCVGRAGADAAILKILVKELGIVVADVDYRLAPEFPYPTPVEDVWEGFQFILSQAQSLNIDPTKILIGGVSAGANLTSVLALRYRNLALSSSTPLPPLLLQLLIVPGVDISIISSDGTLHPSAPESYRLYGDNPILGEDRKTWSLDHYLGKSGSERREKLKWSWEASPLLAESHAGVAPAFIATAEFDILRNDGVMYAEKLRKDGVKVKYEEYKGAGHAFSGYAGLCDESKRLVRDIVEVFREVVA